MKGSYKVYNSNKGEWVNLDHTAAYDNVRIKIENNHLWVSYNYDQGPWEDKGEIISSAALNEKADKTYVDDNFAKKEDIPTNYIVNTGNDDDIAATKYIENFDDSFGLDINDASSELSFAQDEGSYNISGGKITLSGGNATMMAYDYTNEGDVESFDNKLTIGRNGLKYNEREILHADDDGSLNVKNLSIGDLVVSEDIPYRYSFVGKLPFTTGNDDVGYYHVEADLEDDTVEYYGEGHVYSFVVNDCWSTHEEEYSSEYWNRGELKLPAYLIDPEYSDEGDALEFIEGKTENVEIHGSNADYEDMNGRLHPEGYFIRSVPFSLRKTTKATLNGNKIVTKDVLNSTERSILSKCVPSDAVRTNSDWTKISKAGRWDEDDSVAEQSSASVSKDQVVLSSSRNDPDDNFESISVKITSEGFVIERSWREMGESQTNELFKITTYGECYINGKPINQ